MTDLNEGNTENIFQKAEQINKEMKNSRGKVIKVGNSRSLRGGKKKIIILRWFPKSELGAFILKSLLIETVISNTFIIVKFKYKRLEWIY